MRSILKSIFTLRLAACLALSLITPIAVLGQSATRMSQVSGVVVDASGAVITDAKVLIRRNGGQAEQTTTNEKGEFRFNRIENGDHQIEVQKEGFKPTSARLTVTGRPLPPLRIVLPIAEMREEVSVVDNPPQVNTDPNQNVDVIKLDRDALRNLPTLGNDVIGIAARLLDPGSVGSAGPTVIIDGLETTRTNVPASQIQEVRINQNPYSAEFSRPGRGRIEVITKAGSPEYHGELNFTFRDHRLDARNAFASEKPAEQRRIFEGVLTGPIGDGKNSSFLFGAEREEENLQSVVFAVTPSGVVSENVASPGRETDFSFRINHQLSAKSTFSIRYELEYDSAKNDGVGGFNLLESASNSNSREHQLFFTHRMVISPKLINEVTVRIGSEVDSSRSARPGVARLIVLDAFTGGGSQIHRRETENYVQLNEIVSWNQGRHFVRAGLNLPNIARRGLSDLTNFGGGFTFATLADFVNNRPFLFSINQGNGHLVFWQKEIGLFVQDTILVRPNFSLGVGLRFDRQNHLGDNNNFAPRVSFAFAPDKNRSTVIRGGAGIFYDRTGSGPISDRLRFDGQRLREVTILDPGFPDPFSSGSTPDAEPSSIVRFADDVRSPYTIQFSVGIERQLNKSFVATANYINTMGVKLFRSRNINAPLPPFIERPDPSIGVLRQVESSAKSQSHAMELMLRGKVGRFFNGTLQYNLGRAYNNAGGINSLPADNHDLTGEWSRAEFDERHRLNLLSTIEAGDWFNLGFTLSLASGRPYSLTTGRDDNRDSIASDRPAGVRRNSLQGPGSATLDVRWSKEFVLKESKNDEGPTITVGVDAFNVLNRTNYVGFVGNLSSPFFGQAVASRPARRVQLTFGFEF